LRQQKKTAADVLNLATGKSSKQTVYVFCVFFLPFWVGKQLYKGKANLVMRKEQRQKVVERRGNRAGGRKRKETV